MKENKFDVGNVIDVRSKGKLPNRLKIIRVYKMIQGSNSDSYRYDALVESMNKVISVGETKISSSLVKTDYGVYLIAPVADRYSKGYRFVCNVSKSETAINNKIAQIKSYPDVHDVMTSEAYGRNGQLLPNRTAVWVKYRYPLSGITIKNI